MAIRKTDIVWFQLILQRLKDYFNSMPDGVPRSAMAHEIIWLETRVRRTLRETRGKKARSAEQYMTELSILRQELKRLKATNDELRKTRALTTYSSMKSLRQVYRQIARRYGKRVEDVHRLHRVVSIRNRRRAADVNGKPQGNVAGSEDQQKPKHEGVRGPVPGDGVPVPKRKRPSPKYPFLKGPYKTEPPLG